MFFRHVCLSVNKKHRCLPCFCVKERTVAWTQKKSTFFRTSAQTQNIAKCQNLKEGEETKTVQQCRKIQPNFVTYHAFDLHNKGPHPQLKLTLASKNLQVAPHCEVIRFRMTALRSLSKWINCFQTGCQQRIIKGLWGVWNRKDCQVSMCVIYQFCGSAHVLWACLAFRFFHFDYSNVYNLYNCSCMICLPWITFHSTNYKVQLRSQLQSLQQV